MDLKQKIEDLANQLYKLKNQLSEQDSKITRDNVIQKIANSGDEIEILDNEVFGETKIVYESSDIEKEICKVVHLIDYNLFVKVKGTWDSYDGVDYDYSNPVSYSIVEPKTKTVTVYE